LPVIGVPVKTTALGGVDSLYSIVQMPNGIPVATVAIGNAKNAGLLAIRMLGMNEDALTQKLEAYHQKMADESMKKTENLI
jgi:5-(carboxyamino)imidazole ribonucleotide mutase